MTFSTGYHTFVNNCRICPKTLLYLFTRILSVALPANYPAFVVSVYVPEQNKCLMIDF